MITVTIARVMLAAAFGLAAATKLTDGVGRTAETVARFWLVADRWRRPLAMMVIASEGAAALLLATPYHRVGAAIALALALGFAWVVSSALVDGRALVCGCFGSTVPMRVSARLLAADLALAAAAIFVLLAPVLPPARQGVALSGLIVTALVLGGVVQSSRVAFAAARADQIVAGAPVHPLAVRDATGELRSLTDFADRGVVMLWVRSGCPACSRVMTEARAASTGGVDFVIATPDGPDRRAAWDLGFEPAVTIDGIDAARIGRRLRLRSFPSVLVLADQRVQLVPDGAAQDVVSRAVALVRQTRLARAERQAALPALGTSSI